MVSGNTESWCRGASRSALMSSGSHRVVDAVCTARFANRAVPKTNEAILCKLKIFRVAACPVGGQFGEHFPQFADRNAN